MDLRLSDLSPGRRYKILTALVVPRPIAWITTQHADGELAGRVNAAPFSYFNLMGSDPVVVAVGFGQHGAGDAGRGRDKDTLRLIRETGRFTVNLVDEATAPAMHASSAPLPFGESETEALGLSLAPFGDGPPRIAAAPAALSCREHATHLVGDTRVVLGVAEALWVRDGLIDPETSRVDLAARRAVGRLGGGGYTTTQPLDLGPRPGRA